MSGEEKTEGAQAQEKDPAKPGRMRMMKNDFFDHGFTNGCPGCQDIN